MPILQFLYNTFIYVRIIGSYYTIFFVRSQDWLSRSNISCISQNGIQQCVIHQIRNSTKYVSYKDIKALMADLKKVYGAVDEETALYELEQFGKKWDSKYPKISQSWRSHWPELSTYFKYPQSVRMLIYTANSIANFRQYRTKNVW